MVVAVAACALILAAYIIIYHVEVPRGVAAARAYPCDLLRVNYSEAEGGGYTVIVEGSNGVVASRVLVFGAEGEPLLNLTRSAWGGTPLPPDLHVDKRPVDVCVEVVEPAAARCCYHLTSPVQRTSQH